MEKYNFFRGGNIKAPNEKIDYEINFVIEQLRQTVLYNTAELTEDFLKISLSLKSILKPFKPTSSELVEARV